MTRFQKAQMCSSLLPGLSSAFVYFVTGTELKRHTAGLGLWVRFIMNILISVFACFILNAFFMTGKHPILNVIATGGILALSNYYCIQIQLMCQANQTNETKHKIPFKFIAIAAGIIAVICIGIVLVWFLTDTNEIPDTNGETNTSLAIIQTEEILKTTQKYSATFVQYSNSGSHTEIHDATLEEFDYDQSSFSCKSMSGIYTLQATKTTQNTMELTIASSVEKGNMEIFILIDGAVYQKIAANQTQTIPLNDIANKSVLVRFAAESAGLSISVTRQFRGQGDGSVVS